MTTRFKARYDGKALIPEEPLDLPEGETYDIQILSDTSPSAPEVETDNWEVAFQQLVGMAVRGVDVSDEALRRENIYEDRA